MMTTVPPVRSLRARSTSGHRLVAAGAALALLLLGGACRSSGVLDEEREPRGTFAMVRPAVAFEMLRDYPNMPVLDLRTPYEFSGPVGHVRGARNVPLAELEVRLEELSGLKDRTFLIYCGHDECGRRGLEVLREAGFEEVILMDGGIDHWVLRGYGTVTGPPPPVYFPEEDSEEVVVD